MRRVTLRGLMTRKQRLGLTALAIVVGVAFVTGTLVLGDTLNQSFGALTGGVYRHVDFEIRGDQTLRGVTSTEVDSTVSRRPVPQAVAARVSRLPGVQFAYGSVSGYAQLIGHGGHALGSPQGALGISFDPNSDLSVLKLVRGSGPATPHEVVIDEQAAKEFHFAPGQSISILLPRGRATFRISGIVTFGAASSLGYSTLAGFYLPTAQRLFQSAGYYDTIDVLVRPGADRVAVQREIAGVLPRGVQVVSGQTVASELDQAIRNELGFLPTALVLFAVIALLVGAFTIFNTFSITVGQRTRELALLRIVGASRRQIFVSVLVEAVLTGAVASLVGLGLGVLAALGLKALLGAFGIALPPGPLVFKARTPIVALVVGIGVTTLSAVVPARRAVRIPPVAALVVVEAAGVIGLRRRLLVGALAGVLSLALLGLGLEQIQVAMVGVGALVVVIAVVALVPGIASPLAATLGLPLARLLGAPGALGRRNSVRSPGRTAQTAGALMIGLALVSAIAVLGSSLQASVGDEISSALEAQYLIGGSGAISPKIAQIAARVPGVLASTAVYSGQFEVRRSLNNLVAASTAGLGRTVRLHIVAGQGPAAMARGELLVDTNTASAEDLHVGSMVQVTFAQTGDTTMRVAGIYRYNPLLGSYLTGGPYFRAHFASPLLDAVLIRTRAGVHGFEVELNRALGAYPSGSVQTRAQFQRSQQQSISKLLGLVYVLLALAVAVALIGIVNTLLLSVFERTGEIGLLRAVGMQRAQVRWMVRAESRLLRAYASLGLGLGHRALRAR